MISFRWPWFIKPKPNPFLSDPTYAALAREEEERRARHQSVRHIQRAKRELLHQALRRVAA